MASAKSDYGFQHGLGKFLSNVKYLLKYRPTAKRDPKSKLVLIISFPRSGTHALASMINHDKIGMHYYGEFFIFNQWSPIVEYLNKYIPFFSWRYFLNTRRQKRNWQHYRFEQTSLDLFNTLEKMLAFPGTHTVKIFPEHLHINSLQKVIAKFQPHILILRRNHLDRYISLKKADASGKWHEGNSSDIQIEVNDAELNKYITKYIDWYTNVKQTATANGCQILDIEFKDLHNAEVTTQIQKFVSFDGSGIDQLPKTPTIISTTSTAPRKVIGTVSASEFCVALAASLGFLINFNKIELEWATVGGLALGGVIAAPIAAKFVAKLHPKHLGIIVGIAIITINAVNIIRA